MTDTERRFAERAMRRRHVFISLAVAGVVIGALLAAVILGKAAGVVSPPARV